MSEPASQSVNQSVGQFTVPRLEDSPEESTDNGWGNSENAEFGCSKCNGRWRVRFLTTFVRDAKFLVAGAPARLMHPFC